MVGVVAAVAIAIVAPHLALIALGALSIAATATAVAIATAVIGLTLSIGLSLAFRALGVGAPSAKQQVGPPQVFRQSISDSFIIYGKRRVGGLLVFFHPRQSGDNHYRYFVVAVAGHRCQGVVSWHLNDEEVTVDGSGKVTSGKYANAAWLWFQRGLASETANATFVSECGGKWTSAHKGNDTAAIYAKFLLTDDVVQAGMPNITAVIEGRDEIRDPRTGTTGYSRNGPMTFYDWLQIPREEGGFGAYPDEIPDDTWQSAQANVADETVNGSPRYCIDAVLTTGAAPGEVRDALIVNMAGSYAYVQGKHLMRPGYWVPVSATLSEDDLAAGIQVSAFATSDAAANEVQGTYISATDGYQGMPFTTQSVAATDILQMEVDLAFTTNKDQADRVARIMLNRAQCEKTVVWPGNISLLGTRALDTVQLASTRYGLDNYAFSIANWGLSADYGVVLQLREENEEIYADGSLVTPASVPTIDKADPLLTVEQVQAILRDTYPKFGGVTMTTAESGGSASITIPNFALDYVGTSYGNVPITGTTLSSLTPSTDYYPFIDVTGPGDASPTFGAATVYADALNSASHPYRIYLNQKVTTPASGSGGSGSGGGYGGGYGGGGAIP